MPNQLVQARVNGEIKAEATVVLADMGLTVSDAVRMLLTKLAREKTMPRDLLTFSEGTQAQDAPQVNRAAEIRGMGKGKVWMAEDFDEPLEEFLEYM